MWDRAGRCDYQYPYSDYQYPYSDCQYPYSDYQYPYSDYQYPYSDYQYPYSNVHTLFARRYPSRSHVAHPVLLLPQAERSVARISHWQATVRSAWAPRMALVRSQWAELERCSLALARTSCEDARAANAAVAQLCR